MADGRDGSVDQALVDKPSNVLPAFLIGQEKQTVIMLVGNLGARWARLAN
jgi:hypothetical protein